MRVCQVGDDVILPCKICGGCQICVPSSIHSINVVLYNLDSNLYRRVSMGLTVSRQPAKNLTVNRQKRENIYHQPPQKAVSGYQPSNCFKVFQISLFLLLTPDFLLSKNRFNWQTSFHVPKHTHFMVFSRILRLNNTHTKISAISLVA